MTEDTGSGVQRAVDAVNEHLNKPRPETFARGGFIATPSMGDVDRADEAVAAIFDALRSNGLHTRECGIWWWEYQGGKAAGYYAPTECKCPWATS